MPAVIVALAVRCAWQIVMVALGGTDLDAYLVSMGNALEIATFAAIAIGACEITPRLVAARKLGMQIAWIASVAEVANLVTWLVMSRLAVHDSALYSWLIGDAWLIGRIAVIAGFAIASGRRGAWLGAIAIGIAVLYRHPENFIGAGYRAAYVLLVIGERVLVAVMAIEVARIAAPRAAKPEPAIAALRRLELLAWSSVVFDAVDLGLHVLGVAQIVCSLASVAFSIIVGAIALRSLVALVRAGVPRMPSWPWALAMLCLLWSLTRSIWVWSGTLVRYWGRLEDTPLKAAPWIAGSPGVVSALAAIAALVVFARRIAAGELARRAALALAFLIGELVVLIAFRDATIVSLVWYGASACAGARAYRAAQPAVHRATKLTDVFS